MLKRALCLVFITVLSSLTSLSFAQNPQITSGLSWLSSAQTSTGNWQMVDTSEYHSTAAAVDALFFLDPAGSSYAKGIDWMSGQVISPTDYLSRRIIARKRAGLDASAELDTLIFYRNPEGGWGGDDDYLNDVIDTALAARALSAANYADLSVVNAALAYLTGSQNTDGGWGFFSGGSSNTYITALVSATVQMFPQTTTLATAVSKASSYLIAHQNADGGFGSSPSTVYESALAYAALIGVSTDATVLGKAINYLSSTQAADGSWNQDPYSTALALKALYFSENKPATPPPAPTTGTVMGTVVDAATNKPLGGVVATLVSDPSITAATNSSGVFILGDIQEGAQQISLALAGYAPLTLTTKITAGAFINVGSITLSVNPSYGIIEGTVWDADANAPFAGVEILVTGTGFYQTSTAADGTYRITGVNPGTVTVSTPAGPKPGYWGASFTGTLSPGGILIFSPALSTTPPPGGLKGTVTNFSDGHPIEGATITLSPAPEGVTPAVTDASGAFSISGIPVGSYTAFVAAQGYSGQNFTVSILARGETNVNVQLLQEVASSTVSGKVLDAATGNPLAQATVSILESGLTATTGADGSYTLSGITMTAFTVRASAAGYDSLDSGVNAEQYGILSLDMRLTASKVSTLRFLSVNADKAGYPANADVNITAVIENFGDTPVDARVAGAISDSAGNIIAIIGPENPAVSIDSHGTATVVMNWNTAQSPAGDYAITLKATEPTTGGYGNPAPFLLAELSAGLAVTPSAAISGAVSMNPPVALATMQTPVAVRAAVTNSGNVPVTTTIRMEMNLAGTVVYAQEQPVADLAINAVQELDFGSYTPMEGGDYTVTVKPADPSIASDIAGSLYVGPNAAATFAVSPEKAVRGNPTVTGTIRLTGAGGATGTVEDPLVPLVKAAIQKGVNWEQTNSINWQTTKKCYGCHVQTQTIIGLELSRDTVTVDDSKSQLLVDYLKSCQASGGFEARTPGGTSEPYPIETTILYAWSLAYYHDTTQVQSALTKAMDYLITRQKASGYWVSDYYYGSNDWWNDRGSGQPSTPFTAYSVIAAAKAYQLTGLQKYKDSLLKAVNYLKGADHTKSIITAAHIIIGLKGADGMIDDQTVKAAVDAKVNTVLSYIQSKQNADGGWGRYAGNASDPLPTAHVLYAMSHGGISGSDQGLRNGTTYLLNKQNSNGTWTTAFVRATTVPDRYFGVTTWAIISLPITLETIAGVSADLSVSLPSDVVMAGSNIPPATTVNSGATTAYTWSFKGLTDSGKDLQLSLVVNGLELGEQRKIAQDASLSFKDNYTGNNVTIPVDIPSVTGVASVDVSAAVDKQQYAADENVLITASVTNNSYSVKNPDLQVLVEDLSGSPVALVSALTLTGLEPTALPGWPYRIPASVTAAAQFTNKIAGATVDFSSAFTALGIPGKTVDQNSIRVIEIDGSGNLIGEKQAKATFADVNSAVVEWYVDGTTAINATRYFQIYFDSTDHGAKNPPASTNLPGTGSLAGYIDDTGRIYVIESKRDGTFGTPQYVDDLTSSTDNSRAIVLDDFNGDGFVDIIAGSGYTGKPYYYRNKADGSNTFYPKVEIGTISASSWAMAMTAADFNGDGKKDFVVSGNNTSLYLFKGNGDGTFTQTTIAAPSGTSSLRGKAVADFDNDGNIDLLVANCCNGNIYWYRGDGNASFASPVLTGSSGSDPYGLAAGDFDEDGKADFIANAGSTGEVYFIKGNGDGTFAARLLISPNPLSHAAFGTGDFNSDGHLDLLMVTYSKKTVEYYPGRGNGTFGSKAPITTTANNVLGVSVSPALIEVQPLTGTPESVPSQSYNFLWNTGATLADNYRVHVLLGESQEVISESTATFAIMPDIRASSKITADKISYYANQTVTLTSTVVSQSRNAILENLSAKISVQNAGTGQQVYTTTKAVGNLMPGQPVMFNNYWDTGTNAAGTYSAVLEVFSGETVLSQSSTVFEIQTTAATGGGVKGTITASPEWVYQGKPEYLTTMIMNSGNEDLTGLTTTLLVIDPENGQIKLSFINEGIAISRGATVSDGRTVSTMNLPAKVYLAILQVQSASMSEPKTLASAAFEVKRGMEISKNIPDQKRVLVWLNYPWQSGQNCPDRALIEQALTNAGLLYHIVLDKDVFEKEFRNGFYTDIMILGDFNPIEDHFAEELREQVNAGKGLVSSLFNRENIDYPVFDLKLIGSLPARCGANDKDCLQGRMVVFADNEFVPAGSFLAAGTVLRVESRDQAEVAAWIPESTGKGTVNYPAVIRRAYGKGHALFFAFDLGMSATPDAAYEDLIRNSVAYVHQPVDTSALRPGQYVPVELTIKSLGAAFDLRLTESYPEGLRIFDPASGLPVEDNPWVKEVQLGAEETKTVLYYIIAPDAAGVYSLSTQVEYLEAGSYVTYGDLATDFTIQSSTESELSDSMSTLQALSLSGVEAAARDNVIRYLTSVGARQVQSQNDREAMIDDLRKAATGLLVIRSRDMTEIRDSLDVFLLFREADWYIHRIP